MKKLCFIAVFLLSAASYGKTIPTPLLYRLSKKILTETQHFIDDNNDTPKAAVKTKSIKQKTNNAFPLKCEPKKTNKIMLPIFLRADKPTDSWYDTDN